MSRSTCITRAARRRALHWLLAPALWLLAATTAWAVPRPADAVMQRLAADPTWRGLLHMGVPGQPSEVLSTDFFLSPAGSADPKAELAATLDAYDAPWDEPQDAHPRCRFPARYLWLSWQGLLPGHDARDARCGRLARWAKLDRLQSVSLLEVSGYFGNPASSFGHTLLRLNTIDGSEAGGLLDTSLNFGALVPENEIIPVYIFKGLSGGYEAGFSDKFFFAHDRVYSRTEFRDIWDHELALDERQRDLLALHLWEIIGRKFRYYFLTENCAWRIAEVLELVTGAKSLRARGAVWYAPAELFHRLDDAARETGKPLVRSVRFLPSAERTLRAQLSRLDAAERDHFDQSVAQPRPDVPAAVSMLAPQRRADFLEALLAYYQFRLVGQEEGRQDPDDVAAKNATLRARLALPASALQERRVPQRPTPSLGMPPMLTSIGASHDRTGTRAQLRWVPYGNELAGLHGLDNGELVVLDTRISVGRKPRARLDGLDVIRVRKFNNPGVRIPGESLWSWQTQLGWRRPVALRPDGVARLRAYAAFGLGRAVTLGEGLVAYGVVDGVVQSGPVRPLRLEPNAGLVLGSGDIKAWLYVAPASFDDAGVRRNRVGLQATRRLGREDALRLELVRAGTTDVTLAWERHW